MRTALGGKGVAIALALTGAAFVVSACNQQRQPGSETTAAPTDEQREAQMAAEQLAAIGGPASAATRALYEGDFQASGGVDPNSPDEGAWELRLLNDYAQFTRPGLGEDGGIPGARDYHEKGMRVVAGPLTITIMQQACASGGVNLPYTAHVLFEGVAYEGCARRGVGDDAGATWASVLPDLIPAIDACMSRVTSRPARVTIASAMDEGQVSVRIRERDGLRRECVADAAGSAVSVYEPVSDLDRRNGESDPEFQRGGAQPAAGRCQTVEEATDRTGQRLGWLIRQTC